VGMKPSPYEVEVNGYSVRCADVRALRELLREIGADIRKAPRQNNRENDRATVVKKTLLNEDGQYRIALATLAANHPSGIFADELVAKCGFQDNPKGFGGFMTGLRKRMKDAGLPGAAIIRERKKNHTGWKNNFRVDDKTAEALRGWLEENGN
jgi:hypothetical protein